MKMEFEARQIVRTARSGALATTMAEEGRPYVSFCAYACDGRGQPIFLFSDLSDHTRNLAQNNEVSFLCEQASHLANPQAGPRVTLMGKIIKTTEPSARENFLKMHPSAQMYCDFGDFNFYTLDVQRAHFVGGFGRAHWVERDNFLCDSAASLVFESAQDAMMERLSADFPQFAVTCATKLLKQRGKNWKIVRVDADGIDLKLASKYVRYPFETPLEKIEEFFALLERIST